MQNRTPPMSQIVESELYNLNLEDPEYSYFLENAKGTIPSKTTPSNYRRQNKETKKKDIIGYSFPYILEYVKKRKQEILKINEEKQLLNIVSNIEKRFAPKLINVSKSLLSDMQLPTSKFKYEALAPFIIRASNDKNEHIIRFMPWLYFGAPPADINRLIKMYELDDPEAMTAAETYFYNQARAIIPDGAHMMTLYGVDTRKEDELRYLRLSHKWVNVPSVRAALLRDPKNQTAIYRVVHFQIFTYNTPATEYMPNFTMAHNITRKNCLIECAKYEQAIKKNLDTIYDIAPLSTDGDRRIIASENLHKLATQARFRLRVFTAYGVLIDKPIMEYGHTHDKILNIRYDEGHARIMRRDINITGIKYREQVSNIEPPKPSDISETLDAIKEILDGEYTDTPAPIVADTSENVIEEYPTYKIVEEPTGHTMYKDFKPSTFTKDPADDSNLEYAHCFDSFSIFYKLFKRKNKIKATREHIEQYTTAARVSCIKSGIIGGASALPADSIFTICDHVRSYSSFERSEYYMGMPTQEYTREIPVTDQYYKQNKNLFSLAYVVITPADSDMFRIVDDICLHGARKVYLPSPLLACFDVVGIQYTASAAIQTTFNKDFGVIALAEKYNVPKEYPNKAFGKLIAGGLKRDNYTHIKVSDGAAAEMIKYELWRDQVPYNCVYTTDGAEFTAEITQRPKLNSVHINAFIYAYSAAALITEIYRNYRDYSALPCAYYVDGLLYTGIIPQMLAKHSTERGKFKYTESTPNTREFLPYRLLENSSRPRIEYSDVPAPSLCAYLVDLPANNKILVNLPGGIGKTFTILNHLPSRGVAIIAPTNNRVNGLRADMQKLYGRAYDEDIMTCHKFFGIGITKDISKDNIERYTDIRSQYRSHVIAGKRYSAIILDEFTLTNEIILSAVEEVAAKIKATIYILGDIQQCNLGFDVPITESTFADYYTIGTELYPRRPDMQCRHSYEVGQFFDSIRELSYIDQIIELYRRENIEKYGYKVISRDEHIEALTIEAKKGFRGSVAVCGKHSRGAVINAEYLRLCREYGLPVLGISNNDSTYTKYQYANNCPDLYLKQNMKDKSGKIMIAYARSIYTMQGDTIPDDTTLYIDAESCSRAGELYTAITRVRDPKNIILVIDPFNLDEF